MKNKKLDVVIQKIKSHSPGIGCECYANRESECVCVLQKTKKINWSSRKEFMLIEVCKWYAQKLDLCKSEIDLQKINNIITETDKEINALYAALHN